MATSGSYQVLGRDQEGLIKEIDKECGNKWKFQWLEEEVHVVSSGVDKKMKIGDSIVKINLPGKASCEWCHALLSYKGKGLSTLKDHLKTKGHVQQIKTRLSNYGLGSFVQPAQVPKPTKLFPLFKVPTLNKLSLSMDTADSKKDQSQQEQNASPIPSSSSTNSTAPGPVPMVPLADRVATMEAMILSVMLENAMPLSLAPVIVDLAKACSSDPRALSEVRLSKCSARYKIRYGLAKTAMQTLVNDLQATPFSLNVDEATSSNTKKVLSILVSYLKDNQIRVHHIASVELSKVDSATIYNAICDVFTKNNLPWENLISMLCDSCAVMRGHVSGVEKRIRTEKAPHLLDIDGDSCHHMTNIAKKFCAPFDSVLESLFSSLFTDFKWCSEFKHYLSEICQLLGIAYTVPQMYSGTRWLSCYDRTLDTIRMYDAFHFFYFSFLKAESDRDAYRPILKQILDSRDVDANKRKRLYAIMEHLSRKSSTKEGKLRKESIIKALFHSGEETALLLQVYAAVLPIFKEYVCFFQTKQPMAHKLHDFQIDVFRKFLACFMRPEKIPDKLTNATPSSEECHLPLRHIFIGSKPNKAPSKEFMEKVLNGYISASNLMLKKLPLYNTTLMSMSALDPVLSNHTVVKVNLDRLGENLKHTMIPEEEEVFADEVRAYVNDKCLPKYDPEERIDSWWTQTSVTSKYPTLSKVALAALTIFHGPLVESAFSEMARILNKQTARMEIPMLNAIQTARYELKSNNKTALEYFKRKNPKTDPVNLLLCRNMRCAYSTYTNEIKQNEKAGELKLKVKERAETVKKIMSSAAVAKRAILVKANKRKLKGHIESPLASKKQKM